MTAHRVTNRLGARFAVSSNWLFDDHDSIPAPGDVGGTFRATLIAVSAEQAISGAAAMMHSDVIVTAVEIAG